MADNNNEKTVAYDVCDMHGGARDAKHIERKAAVGHQPPTASHYFLPPDISASKCERLDVHAAFP